MWAAQRQDETERIGNGCLFWQVPSCAFPLSFAVFPTRACIHTYYPVCLSVCPIGFFVQGKVSYPGSGPLNEQEPLFAQEVRQQSPIHLGAWWAVAARISS